MESSKEKEKYSGKNFQTKKHLFLFVLKKSLAGFMYKNTYSAHLLHNLWLLFSKSCKIESSMSF